MKQIILFLFLSLGVAVEVINAHDTYYHNAYGYKPEFVLRPTTSESPTIACRVYQSSHGSLPSTTSTEYRTPQEIAISPLSKEELTNFGSWTKDQWERFFAAYDHVHKNRSPHEWDDAAREKLFQLYRFYALESFRQFIMNVPGYRESIRDAYYRMKSDRSFARKLNKIKLAEGFNLKEFIETAGAQFQHTLHQEHENLLKSRFADQEASLHFYDQEHNAALQPSAQHKRMQQRARALQETKQHPVMHSTRYHVSDAVADCMETYGCDTQLLYECTGLPLQHALHTEYLDIAQRITDISSMASSDAELQEMVNTAASSMQAGLSFNHAGYVAQSCILADFCHALLDYGDAVVRGIEDGVRNMAHAVLHPIETVSNMVHCAGIAAYYLGQVLAHVCDIAGTYIVDADLASEKYEACEQVVAAIAQELYEVYERTPGPELVRGGVAFATEAALTHQCGKAMYKLYANGQKTCTALLKTMQKNPAVHDLIALSPEGIQTRMLFNASDELMYKNGRSIYVGGKKIEGKSAFRLLNESFDLSKIHSKYSNLSYVEGYIDSIHRLPVLNCCGDKFIANINQHPLVIFARYGTKNATAGELALADGALYEIKTSIYLLEQGEEIIGYGLHLKSEITTGGYRDFDIVTRNALIECKNRNWENVVDFNKLKNSFKNQQLIAQEYGKVFKVYSNNPFPDEFKNWLNKQGIIYIEKAL